MSQLDNLLSRLHKVRKNGKDLPSVNYLHECFSLADNGNLFWKDRPADHFGGWYGYKGWNKKYAGRCADIDMGNGYLAVCINGKRYKSHRVVFAMSYGMFDAEMMIDHANGNSKDNRPVNLRLCTPSQNAINFKGARKDNKHGGRGVVWKKRNRKWEASYQVNGKRVYLGLFDDKLEAIRIAALKRKELFGEFWESQNG